MSVIVGVIKDGVGAIASDSLFSWGSLKLPLTRPCKYWGHRTGKLFLGSTGSCYWDADLEIFLKSPQSARLVDARNELEVYKCWSKFVTGKTETDIDVLMLNHFGLFTLQSRVVKQMNSFASIGSGRELAIGCLAATYDRKLGAEYLARHAVEVAIQYSSYCGLPVVSHVIPLEG